MPLLVYALGLPDLLDVAADMTDGSFWDDLYEYNRQLRESKSRDRYVPSAGSAGSNSKDGG